MPTSTVKVDATAVDVAVDDDRILVILADGRELAAPIGWDVVAGRDASPADLDDLQVYNNDHARPAEQRHP
jgi:hypothetical protein